MRSESGGQGTADYKLDDHFNPDPGHSSVGGTTISKQSHNKPAHMEKECSVI